jgi:signal transduction histidine kinase
VADPWEGTRAPEEIRTVLEALRENLRRTREEAEHTQLMTSGLAHELRSPLQNLMGESQVTLLRDRTPEEYKRVLESQLEELGELSRAVDNLVNLCADGEAHKRMTRERFDLAEELRLRLAREFQLARRRDVDMELVAEGPLMLDGDRESLLLALRNIVTNAIEWAPPGGNVVVQAQRTEDGTELLVDDDGPGVPPERRERLFEPFQRGGLARGRRVGFGIGLALTRVAVETHGGTIEIGDSPMGGARFRILLPA